MLQMLSAKFRTVTFIRRTALCIHGYSDQQQHRQQRFGISAQTRVSPKGQCGSYQPFGSAIFRKNN
jgi:hypothetical protein